MSEQSASAERDYFTDLSILVDPYEYFAEMAAKGPVCQLQDRDILLVTGFEEVQAVLRNHEDFSSVIAVPGAAHPLPFEPAGDDITEQIEAHRQEVLGGELLVSLDGARHDALRTIMNPLFAPKRLKANEQFIFQLADEMVQGAVAAGGCELVNQIATPYVTLVIADLLGVPEADREAFREVLDSNKPPGDMRDEAQPVSTNPLEFMAGFFTGYMQDRRANPRQDILTELATAKYPDGTLPALDDLVGLAMFLFAAGQDTSAKLLGNAMRFIVDTPGLQQQLRQQRELIPNFLEEVLRLEGSTKATFRLARRNTRVGDVDVPAGKRLLVALAAANRDGRRWEEPLQFDLERPRIREHLAFGRGAHTCAGAPLARAEIRVIIDRFLEHAAHIDLDAARHGAPGARTLDYQPSFIIRGLSSLYLDLQAA